MTTQNTLVRGAVLAALLLLLVFVLALALTFLSKPASASVIKVGLIPDTNGLHDSGFNSQAFVALLQAETDYGVLGTVYTTTTTTEYGARLNQCAADGNALCISVGFTFRDATALAALNFPGTKFAILDVEYPSYPANLRGITFEAGQAAYLAGMLAGSMSQSKVVGDIGGWEIPQVTAFTIPFSNGAGCVTPSASTIITYTNNFSNPGLGADVAQTLISRGADVIFAPAGQTGAGAVITATQSGIWGIGVDTDYFDTTFGGGTLPGANKLLTSVLKRIDKGTYNAIKDVVDGTFTSGTVSYDLASGGVGLAPYHLADPSIPSAVKNEVEAVKQKILAGRMNVYTSACQYHFVFLPVVTR